MEAAVEEQHARAIVLAAGGGELEEVRRLVQQDRRLLDVAWATKQSPLTAAAELGHIAVVRYLVDEGADINLWTGRYGTALDAASTCGRLAVVALLLARGANTQPTPTPFGFTPLLCASYKGHAEIARLLLAHDGGQHIDHRLGFTGGTALHDSCSCRRAPVVTVLLGAGADPRVVDRDGRTPLSIAVTKGFGDCIALLQEWEWRYLLFKARRLHDASVTLRHGHASSITTMANSQTPAYVASRVEHGGRLPEVEVEVEGRLGGGSRRRSRKGVDEGLMVREAVVGHVVEGMRPELVRELMEEVVGS